MPINHPLHEAIGKIASEKFGSDALLDSACGGQEHLPFFCCDKKSREIQFCNVDLLVLKDGEVNVIIEIDESNKKPTQVCGKDVDLSPVQVLY